MDGHRTALGVSPPSAWVSSGAPRLTAHARGVRMVTSSSAMEGCNAMVASN